MKSAWFVLSLSLGAAGAAAQPPPEFVGAWRLVSMARPDSAGRMVPTWDDHPAGLIVYTADGHVSAQLYDSRRAKLGVRWDTASAAVAKAAFAGAITYYGRYAVDQTAGTVTHTVEGAMTPDWIGTKLVRAYRVLGPDRLELRVLTSGDGPRGRTGTVLVWERSR
jgi:hypothetical protein